MIRQNVVLEREYIGLVPEKLLKPNGMIYVSHNNKIIATIARDEKQITVETFSEDKTFSNFEEAIEFVAQATRKR